MNITGVLLRLDNQDLFLVPTSLEFTKIECRDANGKNPRLVQHMRVPVGDFAPADHDDLHEDGIWALFRPDNDQPLGYIETDSGAYDDPYRYAVVLLDGHSR